MNLSQKQFKNCHILVNVDYNEIIDCNWFDKSLWQAQNKITGSAPGRGSTLFFTAESENFALRHYLRGGYAAKLSRDKYIFTGLSNTRAFAELQLTYKLYAQNLPVPEPIAARVVKSRVWYTQDIINRKILDSTTLYQYIIENPDDHEVWTKVGKTIAKFHLAGLNHGDLNMRNILVTSSKVYLIDFDKSSLEANETQKQNNLARLKRSIDKELGNSNSFTNLLTGYHQHMDIK